MLPSSNPLVLVADDEPSMLELVARHLKTMDDPKLEVIEASDGDQAWQMAREHLPDLVVLDVMMPGMSGWEVCRKIREDVALAHTGVVMLTGIGENLNQMTSPLYGADAYIDKPFEFDELDEKVKNALSARAAQREGVTRPAATNVNGVAGPAKAASGPKKAKPAKKAQAKSGAKAKTGAKTGAKAVKTAKSGKASKARKPESKPSSKTGSKIKTLAKAKGTATKQRTIQKPKKGETKMAAKKAAKKTAKKSPAKKTAKKTAKKKAK
jgi:DNA-binding response OmpR family regulator